ncbi:hypothetical protein ACODNH_19960 (plasmid) [Haloarcula sp. NS06]|uniref:hypothetical protein n=1 Tax=Haloarcula sp. NS06 TaxID=3409688 RepID=UPI003DA712EB
MSVVTGVSLAGCSLSDDGNDGTPTEASVSSQTTDDTDDEPSEPPEPDDRITSARRIGPRDVSDFGFEDLWAYRKRQAVEALVSDPRVNDVASDWVASFEAYDPLTNRRRCR